MRGAARELGQGQPGASLEQAAQAALVEEVGAQLLRQRGALVDDDPMFTSVFLANLGSLKIDAAYHHLYEHGNCPLFVTVGKVAPAAFAADDGTVAARPGLTLRYTYDERVEDGLYCAAALNLLRERIEDPASWLGTFSHLSHVTPE